MHAIVCSTFHGSDLIPSVLTISGGLRRSCANHPLIEGGKLSSEIFANILASVARLSVRMERGFPTPLSSAVGDTRCRGKVRWKTQ